MRLDLQFLTIRVLERQLKQSLFSFTNCLFSENQLSLKVGQSINIWLFLQSRHFEIRLSDEFSLISLYILVLLDTKFVISFVICHLLLYAVIYLCTQSYYLSWLWKSHCVCCAVYKLMFYRYFLLKVRAPRSQLNETKSCRFLSAGGKCVVLFYNLI